jgi:hypothetical protein
VPYRVNSWFNGFEKKICQVFGDTFPIDIPGKDFDFDIESFNVFLSPQTHLPGNPVIVAF